jgi:hypothetical protein
MVEKCVLETLPEMQPQEPEAQVFVTADEAKI